MKRILLLTLILGLFSISYAQNNLVIFNMEGKQFYVILNGIKQNAEPKTNVKIKDLNNNSYKVKVIFADGNTPDLDKTIYYNEPNQEYVTELRKNKKGDYKLRIVSYGPTSTNNYQAESTINYTNVNATSTNTNNNTRTNTNTNPNNSNSTNTTTTVVETTTHVNETSGRGGNGENVNVSMNIGGINMGVNVDVNENGTGTSINSSSSSSSSSTTSYTTTTTTTTTSSGNSNTNTGHGNHGCFTSNTDINAIIKAVKNEGFADGKKMVAKQALQNKCISTDQVIKLMDAFSFEDDKLEVAKFCYDRCSDRDNYYKVNSAFSFEDSKEKLNRYIGSK